MCGVITHLQGKRALVILSLFMGHCPHGMPRKRLINDHCILVPRRKTLPLHNSHSVRLLHQCGYLSALFDCLFRKSRRKAIYTYLGMGPSVLSSNVNLGHLVLLSGELHSVTHLICRFLTHFYCVESKVFNDIQTG